MCGFIIGFLHYLNQFCFCSICAGARLFLLFLNHDSSTSLHLGYFHSSSQARSNTAFVHPATQQNICSWQADKSGWFRTSACSFGTTFSQRGRVLFCLVLQVMTAVHECLSQQAMSPNHQVLQQFFIYLPINRFINDVEYAHPALLHPQINAPCLKSTFHMTQI